ncbi:hypothetical protein ACEN9X_19400 [Mucilaginibacter sp. Mucisp86]|uniref:hypothetical protein n=1 Tax=Mucilaginibacter sp. Mucisp86 TaxID=3243060 RepID=UPI0039B6942B
MRTKGFWSVLTLIGITLTTLTKGAIMESRVIHLSGLIVDAQTLAPIASVQLSDGHGHVLGSTDGRGYYNIAITYPKPGQIYFKIVAEKKGFKPFTQNEHWGDLSSNIKGLLYIGLKSGEYSGQEFSEISFQGGSTYEDVFAGFETVKRSRVFESALAKAKSNNEHAFVYIDSKPYLVNNSSWIELSSKDALISISGKKVVRADSINTVIRRSSIKKMTPVEPGKGYGYLVEIK